MMKSLKKSRAIKPSAEMTREPAGLYHENPATGKGQSLPAGEEDCVENTLCFEVQHFSRYAAVISR